MIDTPTRAAIAGVVLAGGQSRRMGGRDKAWQMLAGQPFIAHVLARLGPQVDALAINANNDPAPFKEAFGLPVFADTIGGYQGPLAGVLAALRHARTGPWTHVATAATDTPFFPTDLVERLAASSTTADTIAMAHSGGQRHPVFSLWPVDLADDLEGWLRSTDTLKVMVWVQRHRLVKVDFGLDANGRDRFFNINTPVDLATAEAMIATQLEQTS